MKKSAFAMAIAATFTIATSPASAGIVLANAGFASATNLVDFNGAGTSNTVVGTVGGVAFSGMVFQPNGLPCAFGTAITGTGCIGNFPAQVGNPAVPAGTNPWTMTFGSDIGSLAFGFNAPAPAGSSLNIELFDDASSLVVQNLGYAPSLGADNFSGFVQITGYEFDRVRVTVAVTGTERPNIMLVDNLQFSPPSNDVPEPGALALACIALGSLGVATRRRKRSPMA